MSICVLQRIDPAKNMRRRYEVSLQPTLFGPVAVIRHWGRGGGQSKEDWLATEGEAAAMVTRILTEKRRRGYSEHRSFALPSGPF